MGDMTTEGASISAGIDLSQFYQVFFEEAGENLDNMEQLLLNVNVESADDEELNAIFRCAHSIKGGAATFGFSDVAELTHQMETLLDKLRRHELQPNAAMVDVLLQSGDALRAQLGRHQGSGADPVDTTDLLTRIKAFVEGGSAPAAAPAPAPAPKAAAPAPAPAAAAAPTPANPGTRLLELQVGPLTDLSLAENLVELFKEITDLGTIEPLDAGQSSDGMRRFKVLTSSTDNDLLDLFTFHVARDQVKLMPLGPGFGFHEGAPGAPPVEPPSTDPGYGFFDNAPGVPPAAEAAADASEAKPAAAIVPTRPATPARTDVKPAGGGMDQTTLRVSIEKVDQLINLVGELVC